MSHYDAKSAPLVPGPFGLANTQLMCHFNALMQMLLSCEPVLRVALSEKAYLDQTKTGAALGSFLRAAAGRTYPKSASGVLAALMADLKARRPHIQFGDSTECAGEGLTLLLDMATPEAKAGSPPALSPLSRLFFRRYKCIVRCEACKIVLSQTVDTDFVFNMFHLGENARAGFVSQLLGFVCPHEDFKCTKCGGTDFVRRHYALKYAPEIIVCMFNVYQTPRMPPALPLRFTVGTIKGPLMYEGVATVEHIAGGAGHYVATAKRDNGRFYTFDDDEAAIETVFAPNPKDTYLVAYVSVPRNAKAQAASPASQKTSVQKAPAPLKTSVQKAPTPLQKAPTPLQKAPTPLQKAPTPLQKAPTPLQKAPTPQMAKK